MENAVLKFSGKYIEACGSRKRAKARVRLYPGTGQITLNHKVVKLVDLLKNELLPLVTLKKEKNYDISITVKGGGIESQAVAIQNASAKALVLIDKNLKQTLRKDGFITRDPREKERKKPGLRRARRAPQWQKR